MATLHQPRGFRQRLATKLLNLFGWKVIHEPSPGPKFVVVGYPHTSNWDFLPAIGWAWATGFKMNWIGKRELFNGLLGPIMRRLGGIPLNRDKSKNFVDQVVEIIKSRDEIALVIAAEGTRKRAEYWRSGFYYMALEAGVPIGLGSPDWGKKEVGIGAYLMPTGNIEADFEVIRGYYADKVGHDPEKMSPIRLKAGSEKQEGGS